APFSCTFVLSSVDHSHHSCLRIAFLLSGAWLLSRQLTCALGSGIIMACATMSVALSQNLLEQLVTPGPVVSGHAKYEQDFGNCHEPFSRQSQTRLCMTCHKDIAADRQSARGFHGRQTDAAKEECSHCHTDHKGRDADIVLFDRETFN